MWIYNPDNFRIVEVNEAALDLYGYDREEMLSLTIKNLRPSTEVPKLVEEVEKRIDHFSNAGIWKHQKKNSELIYVRILSHPVSFDDGIYKMVVAQDATDYMKAEALYQHEKKILEGLIKSFPGIFYVIDKQKNILRWNNQFETVTGYNTDEIKEASILDFIPDALNSKIKKAIETTFLGKQATMEAELLTKEGKTIPYFFSSYRISLEEGDHLIGIGVDLSRQKETERELRQLNETLDQKVRERTKQLEEANKELESFTYSISHDLRAPLRAIDGYSKLLLEDHYQDLEEEGQDFLGIIREETKRMDELISELLDFSRMSRTEKNEQKVSMQELVGYAVEEVKKSHPETNARFTINDLPDVRIDPVLFKQVWINLLDNAVKYQEKEQRPKIGIDVKEDDDKQYYIFSVSDNGVGFDMKYVEKLFGVFQRLHSEDEFEGTGIGLALVRRIVNRHGGHTWAESEKGKGSTFYFSLPKNSN